MLKAGGWKLRTYRDVPTWLRPSSALSSVPLFTCNRCLGLTGRHDGVNTSSSSSVRGALGTVWRNPSGLQKISRNKRKKEEEKEEERKKKQERRSKKEEGKKEEERKKIKRRRKRKKKILRKGQVQEGKRWPGRSGAPREGTQRGPREATTLNPQPSGFRLSESV